MLSAACAMPEKYEIWVTYLAKEWLEKTLCPEWRGFEWGSGQGTVWLAHRISSLISLEHDKSWFTQAGEAVRCAGVSNVTRIYEPNLKTYAEVIGKYGLFDIVLVDGRNRVECMKNCVGHVASGGIVVLDNSERARYADGIRLFSRWERKDFAGPGRGGNRWRTTAWIRP